MWGQQGGQTFQGQGYDFNQGGQGNQNWENTANNNPWGSPGMNNSNSMMGRMGRSQWDKNPFYKQNQSWGSGGYNSMPQWQNKHNCYIPPIEFNGGCRKCHGTGTNNRRGMPIPCRVCYKKRGICPNCFGNGINYFHGRPCRRCKKGQFQMRQGRRMSRSSSSDDGYYGAHGQGAFGNQGGFGGQQGGFGGQQGGLGGQQGGFGVQQSNFGSLPGSSGTYVIMN